MCNPRHLETPINHTEVVPAVNQVELDPYFIQRDVRDTDASHGVATQSWSPLSGVNVYHAAGPNNVKTHLST